MWPGLICVVYVTFLVGYGIVKGGRARSLKEFSGVSSEPPLAVMTASMCASFIGGGFSLGNAERAFSGGMASAGVLVGFSVGQIFAGLILAPRFARFNGVSTAGGIIEQSFGEGARMLCGALSALFCAGVLGAQINAVGTVAGYLFSLPPRLCSLIGFAVIAAYAMAGGLKASLKSDALQIVILGLGLLLAAGIAVARIGASGRLSELAPVGSAPVFGRDGAGFAGPFAVFALGEMLCPPSAQRMLLSANPKRVRMATVLSGAASAPFFAVTALAGICARVLGTTGTPAFAMPSLISETLGFPLGALCCAAMLCVYLSSGGAFLNSCASALGIDVIGPLRRKKAGEGEQLSAARLAGAACGCCACAVALGFKDVLEILELSYSFWAPIMLAPLTLALFGKRYPPRVFMAASAVAAAALILWRALGEPGGLPAIVAGLAADIAVYCVAKPLAKASGVSRIAGRPSAPHSVLKNI